MLACVLTSVRFFSCMRVSECWCQGDVRTCVHETRNVCALWPADVRVISADYVTRLLTFYHETFVYYHNLVFFGIFFYLYE